MKRNASPSRRPFNPTESEPDYLGPILPEVTAPIAFPHFPSIEEILAHENKTQSHPLVQMTETAPPSKPTSLLDGLLGGDAGAVIQDAEKNPERYDEVTRAFLTELGAGQHNIKALPQRESELLSRAVYDFAAFRPSKTSPLAPKVPPKKKPALLREEGGLADARAMQMDIPDDPLPPYWWL